MVSDRSPPLKGKAIGDRVIIGVPFSGVGVTRG